MSMAGEGTEFGKIPLVTKLMKGIYNKKENLLYLNTDPLGILQLSCLILTLKQMAQVSCQF